MHPVFDPLLNLQLLGAVLIVLTLPDQSTSPEPDAALMPSERAPFELADGNTYVEHAGMAIEADRMRSFRSSF
jgi:hypothetical protein